MFISKSIILLIISAIYCQNIMASYKVETIPNTVSILGEGPHWDIERQSLYSVDIYGGAVYRYDFNEKRIFRCEIENEPVVSFIIPVKHKDDEFAIGIGRRIGIIKWDGIQNMTKVTEIVMEVEKSDKYKFNRFNDGKADPHGRFYGGTMRLEQMGDIFEVKIGSLYRMDNRKLEVMLEDIGVSNGLAWNEETNKMYYIDSVDLNVKEFDYNPSNGDICNPRVVIDFHINNERPGFVPDGMTIDNQGNLFVALFGGSAVYKIKPNTGEILQKINLPAEQITSAAFGGPNLDTLFVTSASMNDKPQPAGSIFIVTGLNATGTKMHKLEL